MRFLIRASGVVAALAIALPALAQQGPTHKKHAARISSPAEGVTTGYLKYCGARFVCYTGIPLDCTPDTRPYQNIAEHQCYCLRDNCP